MKAILVTVMASVMLLALSATAQKDGTFTGEIMDSQCALLGGHQNMIKPGEDAKACSKRCVSLGGKYVLFDNSSGKKMSYQLDNQKKAEAMAGEKVTVSGTYDAATKTIKVASIKPQS